MQENITPKIIVLCQIFAKPTLDILDLNIKTAHKLVNSLDHLDDLMQEEKWPAKLVSHSCSQVIGYMKNASSIYFDACENMKEKLFSSSSVKSSSGKHESKKTSHTNRKHKT
jgi:hypothetical protein